nr:protein kinase-like domain, concanavalin A-like lectin/glucanase domain protein [Tanacetum cinerariifolium]
MSISITQFNHLRIPLNNFSEDNKIGRDDFGYIYEGQLLRSGELINISARRLDRSQGLGDIEFLTEVSVLSTLNHPNIVSLIGFCDEKDEKIIINTFEAKGNLCMYLDDLTLTWIQRLKISVGVARAICYLHYEEGRNYSIIHRNINSSTVLLDDNFEARKAFLPDESEDNMFLTRLVDIHLVNNTLEDIQIQDVWNQMELKSWINFARVAFMCLLPDRTERIGADTVFFNLNQQLKTHLDAVTPTSQFAANADIDDVLELPSEVVTVESTSSNTWKVRFELQ